MFTENRMITLSPFAEGLYPLYAKPPFIVAAANTAITHTLAPCNKVTSAAITHLPALHKTVTYSFCHQRRYYPYTSPIQHCDLKLLPPTPLSPIHWPHTTQRPTVAATSDAITPPPAPCNIAT